MSRVRTMPQAIEELRKKDPGTPVSLPRLRIWVKQGIIRSVPYSNSRVLVDVDDIERFLAGE